MFNRFKKNRFNITTSLFTLQWYPSNRCCINIANRKAKIKQMPPLMVRKAEWRR